MVRPTGGPVQSHKGRCQILAQVADIVELPSATGKYDAFKARLISAFAVSEETENRELLAGLELRDQKPSQLLRAMRMKSADRLTDNFLKTLWLQRLPSNVQTILNISETSDLTKLSEMADRIMEIREPCGIAAVSSSASFSQDNTEKELAYIRKSIDKLQRGRSYSRNSSRSRKRTPSRKAKHPP